MAISAAFRLLDNFETFLIHLVSLVFSISVGHTVTVVSVCSSELNMLTFGTVVTVKYA